MASRVNMTRRPDGVTSYLFGPMRLHLYDDYLIWSQGVLGVQESTIYYRDIISVTYSNGGLFANAYFQINTAGQIYKCGFTCAASGLELIDQEIQERKAKSNADNANALGELIKAFQSSREESDKISADDVNNAASKPEWVCDVCGYLHEGDTPPEKCPICKVSSERFKKLGEEKPSAEKVNNVASKPEWVCNVCGYLHEGDTPPEKCPICKVSSERFKKLGEEKPSAEKVNNAASKSKWECDVCGYLHEGDTPPEKCPICKVSSERFKKLGAKKPLVPAENTVKQEEVTLIPEYVPTDTQEKRNNKQGVSIVSVYATDEQDVASKMQQDVSREINKLNNEGKRVNNVSIGTSTQTCSGILLLVILLWELE